MITRYRGDTQDLEITLTKNKLAVDLTDVSKVEFGINKSGTVLIIECVKNADPLTGIVYTPFIQSDLDTVGMFNFDVQVSFTNGTRTTFIIDKIKILDDINKT